MAQVPMRMAQPGLVPPHQQRPPMMVSMTQPPPVTMQGLVTMAPMMGPSGGMAVMTQAMSHPDSGHEHHHAMNTPYHPHHPPPHPSRHHPGHHTQPNAHTAPPNQYHHQQNMGGQTASMAQHHSHNLPHLNSQVVAHHSQGYVQTSNQPQAIPSQHPMPSVNSNPHPIPSQSQSSQQYCNTQPPPTTNTQQPPQPSVTTTDKPPTTGGVIVLSNANNRPPPVPATTSSNSTTTTTPETPITNGTSSFDSLGVREKTPMCLINELARFNKIQHQYCLTDEKGPAHKKVFTVTLRLGDGEEYSSSGPSIKKAQHAAAAFALESTKFKHPPPKPPRQMMQAKLTPTVELNTLAMKRGESAVYCFVETPRPPNPYAININNMRFYNQQKFYCRPPMHYPHFSVNLKVGGREYVGEGMTPQQAKHHAASKALKAIKALPMPNSPVTQPGNNEINNLTELDPNADLKSPISLVHEIALKRNLTVNFDVVKESGPPHMRTFITTCIVGDTRSTGEGTGKKASKKRAAEAMLEDLKNKLPPLPANVVPAIKRKPTQKKKSRNLIKVGSEEQKSTPDYGQGINPISRLIQIQQAKKEKEPVYTLIAEKGVPRRREFVMQVSVGNEVAQGCGTNKKLAKRAAAENMLQKLGYSRSSQPPPPQAKSALRVDGAHEGDKTRKQVTFLEEAPEHNNVEVSSQMESGRQVVPGLIMMSSGYQQANNNAHQSDSTQIKLQSTIAKELLESGSSSTAKAISKQAEPAQVTYIPTTPKNLGHSSSLRNDSQYGQGPKKQPNSTPPCTENGNINGGLSISGSGPTAGQGVIRPKDNLMYLANILNIQVQFTDFPKSNKGDYLSLVSLSTTPPHVYHGGGPTIDASHDQACLEALKKLAEMGLDSVTSGPKS